MLSCLLGSQLGLQHTELFQIAVYLLYLCLRLAYATTTQCASSLFRPPRTQNHRILKRLRKGGFAFVYLVKEFVRDSVSGSKALSRKKKWRILCMSLMKVIYKSALAMASLDPHDCVAVGDSLHHDIKGANNAGIESVLITGGIHAAELGLDGLTESPDTEAVRALASKYNAHPSYVLPSFSW